MTPDELLGGIPQVATHYDQPFGNSSAVPSWLCARNARSDGITRMLAGDGGDEFFGGNSRYAKQRIFCFYEAVPGIVDALGATPAPVVAVSPIVGGAPVSGPAGALMAARGLHVSPLGVAAAYALWLDALVIDRRDAGLAGDLERAGVRPEVADALMPDAAGERALARLVLAAVRRLAG